MGQVEGQAGMAGGRGLLATILSPPPPADLPSVPLLLTVEDVSDSSVTVSWEPPERLGRLGLQGYLLELRREGGELGARPCMHPGGRVGGGQQGRTPNAAVGQWRETPLREWRRGMSERPLEGLVPQLQRAPERQHRRPDLGTALRGE